VAAQLAASQEGLSSVGKYSVTEKDARHNENYSKVTSVFTMFGNNKYELQQYLQLPCVSNSQC
jgi:hypothetical protein